MSPRDARGVPEASTKASSSLRAHSHPALCRNPELGAGPMVCHRRLEASAAGWPNPARSGRFDFGSVRSSSSVESNRLQSSFGSAPGARYWSPPLRSRSTGVAAGWRSRLECFQQANRILAKIGTAAGLALPVRRLSVQPALGFGREARALNTAVREPVRLHTASTQLPLRLAMGGCSRYPIAPRAVGIRRPKRQARKIPRAAPLPEFAHSGSLAPQIGGLVALHCMLKPTLVPPAAPISSKVGTIPQPLRTEPIHPSLRLEPLDAKPAADLLQPDYGDAAAGAVKDDEAPAPANASAAMGGVANAHKAHLWNRAAGFWKLAPRDLKLLAFAIPLLLALAFHRELPKVRVSAPSAPSTVDLSQNVKAVVVNTRWSTVRQAVVDRAAVALDEDFRSGLDDWASRSDATAEWSFDAAGFG